MNEVEHRVLTLDSRPGWEDWDLFLNAAHGASVFHREGWLRSVGEGMGQDLRVHVAAEAGRIRAGAVVRRGGRWGLRSGYKPWATAYNGIVADREAGPRCAEALCAALRGEYASLRLVQAPGADFHAPPGWTCRAWPTLLLDVRDPERLWNACDRRVRQRVRKARNLGITVDRSDDAELFEGLYRMTYERQGLGVPLSLGSMARTLAYARARGTVDLHVASTADGEPAAALVVGEDAGTAYFMLAASHPMLRHTDAVTLLWWTAIEDCALRVRTVDLVGAGTSEIERFKRSFAPEAVDCADAVADAVRWKVALRLTGRRAPSGGARV